MCGTYHSMMNFEVRVVEPNDFKAYLQQRWRADQRRSAAGDQPAAGGFTTHRSTPAAASKAGAPPRPSK